MKSAHGLSFTDGQQSSGDLFLQRLSGKLIEEHNERRRKIIYVTSLVFCVILAVLLVLG